MFYLWNPTPLILLRSVLGTQSADGVMDGQMLINRVPDSEPHRRKDLWRASGQQSYSTDGETEDTRERGFLLYGHQCVQQNKAPN